MIDQIRNMMQTLQNVSNPSAYFQQLAQQDPVIAKAMQMTQGKSPQEINQIINNLARERGIDINQVKNQLGIRI